MLLWPRAPTLSSPLQTTMRRNTDMASIQSYMQLQGLHCDSIHAWSLESHAAPTLRLHTPDVSFYSFPPQSSPHSRVAQPPLLCGHRPLESGLGITTAHWAPHGSSGRTASQPHIGSTAVLPDLAPRLPWGARSLGRSPHRRNCRCVFHSLRTAARACPECRCPGLACDTLPSGRKDKHPTGGSKEHTTSLLEPNVYHAAHSSFNIYQLGRSLQLAFAPPHLLFP